MGPCWALLMRATSLTSAKVFMPIFRDLLPPFPHGNWNIGHISKNTKKNQSFFSMSSREKFPGVKHTWHNTYVDYFDLIIHDGQATLIDFESAYKYKDEKIMKDEMEDLPW